MPQVSEYLYVSRDANIDLNAARLNLKLGLMLQAHHSEYFGDYYLDTSCLFDEIRLCLNADPLFRAESDPPDDFWFEPNYRDYPLLLYAYGPEDVVESLNIRLWHCCPSFDFGLVRSATFTQDRGHL